MAITALAIVVPMIAAAVLVAVRHWTPRLLNDLTAAGVGITVITICAILLVRAVHHPFVYWMGGWRPSHLVAVGISLSIDPIGAGMATFAAMVMTAVLIYSWRYFDAADGLFHALMLVFLAAMVGFCLTGDLFNLIVFFELMGAVAYALTAYQIEERGPIQGAINFAITNSVGAYARLVESSADAADIEQILSTVRDCDVALVAVCARVAAYKGSVALGQAHAEVLSALDQANIPIIATVLGNPYVLPRMPERATTLLTFESAVESEEAAVRVISGEVPARGRSPVALPQES